MKIFLSIAAVLAWVFGLGLLLAPAGFYSSLGIVITPVLATIAQAHGATLVGLGVINWFARNAEGQGLKAVLFGNVIVQALSLFVAFQTFALVGKSTFPAMIIHTVLGSFFLFFLLRVWKTPAKK